MADAKITLNLSPREFDIVREVLQDARDVCSERSRLSSDWSKANDAKARQANNQRGLELENLLRKLK